MVKGTNVGTTTNTNGRYSLQVSPKDTLVFSFVGYQERVVPVKGRSEINIRLRAKAVEGEGVVVTGYTEGINRTDVTGAVSEVPMADLEKRRVPEEIGRASCRERV